MSSEENPNQAEDFQPMGTSVVDVEEVVLSSDSEGDELERENHPDHRIMGEGGVELLTIRPKSKSHLLANPNEDHEGETEIVRDVQPEDRSDPLNLNEKKGYVKECVEEQGLAVIFSKESGLVIFHQEHCFHHCARVDFATFREVFTPGMEVCFLDTYHEGEEFKCVSQEGFIRQAAAVWVGPRPNHLLRQLMSEQHGLQMRHHRKRFLHYVRSEAFMALPLCRVSGNITGYLTEKVGLIETTDADSSGNHKMVVFNVDDLYIYKTPIQEVVSRTRKPVDELVPVGLRVFLDARSIAKFRGVEYQAINVFAGTWPPTPHPTILPCGDGSVSVCYEIPEGQTFHYLQLSLGAKMDEQLQGFKDRANAHGTDLRRSKYTIDSGKDYYSWLDRFAPSWKKKQAMKGPRGPPTKRKTTHEFKKSDTEGNDPTVKKPFRVKEEVKKEIKMEKSSS